MKTACIFCQTTLCFEEELREKNLIVKIRRWKIGSLYILRKIQIKLHYFLFKMEEKIVVKYYSTQYGKEPYKAQRTQLDMIYLLLKRGHCFQNLARL